MKCKQAKAFIALWVGNDLESDNIGKLERHVAVCPCCRVFWKKIQQTQQVLQQIDDDPIESGHPDCQSIWQEISHKIDRNSEQYQRERFNGWVPAIAVVSACLLLLFYSHSLSHIPVSTEPTFDVFNSFSEVAFPEVRHHNGLTPARWSDSPPPRNLSIDDSYLAPFPFESPQTSSKEEFKQTVELPATRP